MTVFKDDNIPEFKRDLKKLNIPSINSDLKLFEKAFSALKSNLTGLVQISKLEKKGVYTPIFKARKFRCKSLNKGSKSGIRLTFAYIKEEDMVIYIEIYNKNRKENHDEGRIIKYFKGQKKSDIS